MTDQVLESIALMKIALDYPASATETSMSPPSTDTCLVAQPLMPDPNDKCIPPALPTGPLSIKSQMLPSLLTLKNESQGVEEVRTEDIIIVIMGPTGSGKSSFIDKVVTEGMGEGVGHGSTSCTREVKATRCTLKGSSVVLVDTPGFDDTERSDWEILEIISNWLNEEYQTGTILSALLWFHRISDNRMGGSPLKNLRVFEKLCGKCAMSKVVLVTTMWDEVEYHVGEARLEELKVTYWKAMISRGSKTFEYGNTRESAIQLIQSVVLRQQETTRKGVQLQVEISDLEMELRETAAGRELCSSLEELTRRRKELLRRLQAEAKGADPRIAEDLRRECDELQAQLESILIRGQALRMTKFQRFWQSIQKSWKRK